MKIGQIVFAIFKKTSTGWEYLQHNLTNDVAERVVSGLPNTDVWRIDPVTVRSL